MKSYDLTGEKFGRLLVVSRIEKNNGRSNWLCRCDCGNQKIVDGYSLKSGRTTSCGCYKNELNQQKHSLSSKNKENYEEINPVGKTYGCLRVLSYAYSKNKHKYYLCLCEKCNSEIIVRYSNLTSGHTISCGCVKSVGEEKVSQWLCKNKINFQKQYSFEDCRDKKVLPFDFAIFDNKQVVALIEIDGKQHHKPIDFFGGERNLIYNQLHDKIKTNYSIENNLPLIRISTSEIKNNNYTHTLRSQLESIVELGSQQSHS